MARPCTICTHPQRKAIDAALATGTPYRQIATRYETSVAALRRHKAGHLGPQLVKAGERAAEKRVEKHAESLVARIDRLVTDAEAILAAAKKGNQSRLALFAIRELRESLKLYGQASGEFKDGPTVQILNVQTDPGWIAARNAMMRALAPFPDARLAVVAEFRQLPGWIEPAPPRGLAPVALAPFRPQEDEDPFGG